MRVLAGQDQACVASAGYRNREQRKQRGREVEGTEPSRQKGLMCAVVVGMEDVPTVL